MTNKQFSIAFTAYLLIAVFTFGHNLNNKDVPPMAKASVECIVAPVLWPLYWSWEVQK